MVARLQGERRDTDLLPPLIDAKLILLNHDRMVLTGVERDILTRRDTAQTWLLLQGSDSPQGAGLLGPD